MKIAEVTGGLAATLRVRSTSGPFQPVPPREEEVQLTRSADQTLLSFGGAVWAVAGVTPADDSELTTSVGSGLPMVAFVVQATADVLILETRRFTQELRVTEPLELGVDEKVLDDIRLVHRFGGTVADVGVWLEDRLLIPPVAREPTQLRRLVIANDARGRLEAFRIYGHRIAADVRRVDDKLRIERVVRGGRNDHQRLTLLSAPVSVVDATLAAELHGNVRTTLSQAVTSGDSYLQIWQTYHKIEQDTVQRRARTFGVLEYTACALRREDGGWRFTLASIEDLASRLALLGESERFELEAGDTPPVFDGDRGPAGAPRKSRPKSPNLTAAVVHIDEQKRFIDLAAPDDDDEQPRPPKSGYLYLATGGDEARLERRRRAEEALRTGNCPLPQLGLLMEGQPAPAARMPRREAMSPAVREVFGAARPTQRQIEAIERALNTPDICLIQGPPGTGKTQVISAIERRLAELADDGVEPSQRILVTAAQHDAVENVVQRSEVFGLPAMKVGRRRRGSDAAVDPAQVFADERLNALRARVGAPPMAERLAVARRLAVACIRTRSLPAEQAGWIRDLVRHLDDLVPHDLRDRALERAAALEHPTGASDPEALDLMIQAARAIRVDDGPFSDDGPLQARKALRRLDALLTAPELAFLERCAAVEPEQVPSWLAEGRVHRDALIDRLSRPSPAAGPHLDEDTRGLLLGILDAVDRRLAATRAGDGAAIASYLHDLETDPDGVREALQHYTVVLAATLQQSAGKEMRRVRGIDGGQTTFESVIVDEAARANPLDLFIPLSMARRRVVLVGDHRQLPHILEPDVERQLAEGVDHGTVAAQTLQAVQASLFERLWVMLRALEQRDGIRRTVTLDAQYRMHPELGRFVSREFYEVHGDGEIESPRRAAEFAHDLPGYVKAGEPCAAAWLDVPGDSVRARERSGRSKSRPAEADAIAREVHRLIDHDPTLTFGVIAFYAAQVDAIGEAMIAVGLTERANNERGWRVAERWALTYNAAGKPVERLRIGTVDAFQGKEFDVVFLSVTRSNDLPADTDEQQRRKYGHLMLENRLCVAMSRQQRLLVAVGDLAFVKAAAPLRALQAFIELCGGSHGTVR
ncbi:AAA domain-containing protein [Nannocystis sp. RBIL2]|uniref:DEAD/DEAH box helicase n=1 Tax=Nannocystis sp. RBIL2 TaxID=2996788 RepID=UPI00226EBE09|nr:AAA domain-containing protein [Nannocystis sp. RBIL2]MCY1065598.1 AAA domain-containing protein [Nannocystis sp. RBIL2]